jgi:hypothetical protein
VIEAECIIQVKLRNADASHNLLNPPPSIKSAVAQSSKFLQPASHWLVSLREFQSSPATFDRDSAGPTPRADGNQGWGKMMMSFTCSCRNKK